MSFIFSQALVAEFSQANCSETDASVPSNTSPTPKPCLWHDKTMEPSRLSRFGMTCAPLTEDRGAELLTWFAEASRARTSALQGGVMGWMESAADCGQKWRASFARFDPALSSWKTAQCSLLGGSEEFLETWPRWGSMRNGVSYLRQIPALPICESASGLWPTPTRRDYRSDKCTPEVKQARDAHPRGKTLPWVVGGLLNPEWTEWLMGWPIGHTGLKPLATGRYREWLQQHSPFCLSVDEVAA